MKPFEVAGQTYNKEALANQKEQMITLRDSALRHNYFSWSVILSHQIGILSALIEVMEE